MSEPILQERLPHAPWTDPRTARLPGTLPLTDDSWIVQDEAFAAQMAERDRLIAERPGAVHALTEAARPAAEELCDLVLARLAAAPGYRVGPGSAERPDGVPVPLDRTQPLLTLGRLVQEDLCLLQKRGGEHVLTGAILCFPASWSLDEKLGRGLVGIHRTVRHYDEDLRPRVQRMFDLLRPGAPLWRMNALVYVNPALHQPGREGAPRTDRTGGQYVRAERQCILKLPRTGAVVFAIHTWQVLLDSLAPEERTALFSARL
jgi:hypothetical protein